MKTEPIVIIRQDELTQEDRLFITSILQVANITKYELINSKYYRIPNKDTLYIVFGEVSLEGINGTHFKLPALSKLFLVPGGYNDTSRQEAYESLKVLASQQETANIVESINQADLPDLSEEQLLALEKALLSKGIKAFTGLNKEGKSIRIRLDSSDKEEADIVINLHELIAIKMAINLLHIEEVHIVRSSREDISNNSSK